jgi:hypothetical protein
MNSCDGCLGIEIESRYCQLAEKRLAGAARFIERQTARPEQRTLRAATRFLSPETTRPPAFAQACPQIRKPIPFHHIHEDGRPDDEVLTRSLGKVR